MDKDFLGCKFLQQLDPRDFPWPDLGQNTGPFPIQKRAKTSQNSVYNSNFLVLHLGENFMKIQAKIAKFITDA